MYQAKARRCPRATEALSCLSISVVILKQYEYPLSFAELRVSLACSAGLVALHSQTVIAGELTDRYWYYLVVKGIVEPGHACPLSERPD